MIFTFGFDSSSSYYVKYEADTIRYRGGAGVFSAPQLCGRGNFLGFSLSCIFDVSFSVHDIGVDSG